MAGEVKRHNELIARCREIAAQIGSHEHDREDFYCLNLTSWIGERAWAIVEHVDALQAQLAAQAEVIAATRVDLQFIVNRESGEVDLGLSSRPGHTAECDSCYDMHNRALAALARFDASPQEARDQAAERAVRAGIVLPNPEGYQT